MLSDFRTLDRKEIEADLCIIGAGAAGITLARELSGSGVRVCILESGGLEYEPEIQALHEGLDVGFQEGSTVGQSRLRFLGGTTNHWVGHCAPYGEMDFEVRPWIPHSGWPIRKKDLDPYYQAAQALLEIGPYRYNLAEFPVMKNKVPAFDPRRVVPRVWQMSPPTRFGTRYRRDLEQAHNVRVYLHANVTELETSKNASRVHVARIRTLDGQTGLARAKYFVLACGGIENARILLLSNRAEPKGLGNRHDLVGRFYMDHLRVEGAAIAFVENDRVFEALLGDFRDGGVRYEPLLCPADESQRRNETLNWCVQLSKMPETAEWAVAARDIRDDLRAGKWPDEFGKKIWAVLSDLDSAAKGLARRFRPTPLSFLGRCECAPNPDSRITLTTERDALGQNKAQRNWRITTHEKQTLRSAMRLLGEETGRLGLGRVKLPEWLLQDNNDWPGDLWGGGIHHEGTTRMASDPRKGVVNSNCRVHTVENLYVAGSSVFPTSGYTHPTLTVGALTLRLAQHLKGLFRG